MASAYPNTIPSFTTKVDQTDVNWANDINRLQDEVVALSSELGTTPSTPNFATVAARLSHLQTSKSDVGHDHDSRYVRRNLATSKGMVVVSTGADAFTAVSAGSNGQSLIADDTQASGVRWQTISHGGIPGLANDDHPHYLNVERHSGLGHEGVFEGRSIRDLGDVADSAPTVGYVLKWSGSEYTPQPDDDTKEHGNQGGLGNDDHTQYLNEGRHHNRALHDAIGITHNSLTGLTSGHPHTQYPRKASAETVSATWNFTSRPNVSGDPVVSGADSTRRIFIRSTAPSSPLAGDVWFRP